MKVSQYGVLWLIFYETDQLNTGSKAADLIVF